MSDTHELPAAIDRPHALSGDEVLQRLRSGAQGLTADEASGRLAAAGPNRLPSRPAESLARRMFKHFNDTLIYILIVAGVVTALLGHWVDTVVILGVVVVNAVIGFIQEGKAEKALAGIRKMLSLHAQVRRAGEWREIEAEQLVPGDVVRLRSGDRVPADLRLLEEVNLRIEESALTGESVASEKRLAPVAPEAGVGDRFGMAFSGTLVTAGRGLGVVTATGAATELGRISTMIEEVETLATPLTRQMSHFGRRLAAVIVGLAGVMFFLGRALHEIPFAELFFAAIGFAVAAIPEGLPAILTITLALGVQRMARRNAITRKLNAVETLGSVTVVCSDKTGTLTRNEMTVRHVVTPVAGYAVEGAGYDPTGKILHDGRPATLAEHSDLHALVQVMAVCNDSEIFADGGLWNVRGEPTEGALQSLAGKTAFAADNFERLGVIPFESDNKFMATLNRLPEGEVRILLKGAPDRLLERCRTQRGEDGKPVPLDGDFWDAQIATLGGQGLRVLAAAERRVDDGKTDLTLTDVDKDMVFVGLVGIVDPPRPEATAAIATCQKAGIRVKMITGDHAETAAAIGREMGLGEGREAVVGATLETASDEELQRIVREHDVFARTSPEHKLRLVKALQANGEVVAMTGDGVNDAPALKRADVGVAMGIKGTEATKEAADIVLADDNFTSIEHAIEEGRTIYDNLRKTVLFILPTNGAEGLVVLVAVLCGLALPIIPVQLLWVNMVTAVTLGLALAFEPADADIMLRPPRRPDAPILGAYFLWRIGFVSLLIGGATIAIFLVERHLEVPLELARTVAVNTIVLGQVFYLFNCRFLYESSIGLKRLLENRIAWAAVAVLALLQLMFVYAPFMNAWFGTAPLAARHWLIPLAVAFPIFLIVEAEKAVVRRTRESAAQKAGRSSA